MTAINSYNYKVLKNINPEVGLNFTPVNIFEKLKEISIDSID